MKIIDLIQQSKELPNKTNVLWDDGKFVRIYRDGAWEPMGLSEDSLKKIETFIDNFDGVNSELQKLKDIIDSITCTEEDN